MKRTLTMIVSSLMISTTAFAETAPTDQSLEAKIETQIDSAIAAVEADNLRAASIYLETASENASRLELQQFAESVAARAPLFDTENIRFALAQSATFNLENFLRDQGTFERRFKDDKGKIVIVREYGEYPERKEFVAIAEANGKNSKESREVIDIASTLVTKKPSRDDDGSVAIM